ncbi:DNA-binding LacI/PurR family transcriptional regulator [Luteibacter sp. Sphag1AF]|uniref:LacI family DNA-binding transcriptional regulator n=1 Tax=Luteibacter sp. Sphag1AF TaxID=2587031 RepID=UPI00160B2E49|nr:LacI family DNA-binding transcriptional regulator [Luteibacter sp. Sphag1AF]MBB3227534.1 DNA-binding LacI/PurR family transcriptional regulator [Luteibacter sp. Sphag1AF]
MTRRLPTPELPVARPRARDVADAAGVSISAVSRTFTDGASVSAKTRDKVLAAAEQLGYQPNPLARSLMTGRTELIGLVSNHFANPAFMDVFDLFSRELQARGLRPLLANLGADDDGRSALDMLRQYNVDAVLVATSAPPRGFTESCRSAGMPLLHVFGRAGQRNGVPVVTVDNLAGGQLAGEAMMARGLRRVAFLGGAEGDAATQDRGKAFASVAGRALKASLFAGDYTHEHGRRAMHQLLDDHADLDGVFCGDDVLALGAMDACRERGIDVPGQISIVGFDDMPLASWPAFQLTTVRQPMHAMVLYAIERIVAWMAQPDQVPRSKLFSCEWVERRTLRALATSRRAR